MANIYKKYNLLLDPNDEDDLELIQFLEELKGNKRKNSYSAILRASVNLYMATKKGKK